MNTKFLYKTLFATFVTVAFFAPLKAQVIHSVGGTIPLGIRTYTVYADAKNTDAYYLVMLSYGFRVNLSETDNSSFSVGPLFSAGGGIYSDSYGSGFLYSGDLQAWVDFNSGLGAVQDSPKNTGFYLGAGFGGSYTGADGEAIDDDNGISFGPMVRTGLRFRVQDSPMAVGIYYKHGIENARWKTIGFHVLIDL